MRFPSRGLVLWTILALAVFPVAADPEPLGDGGRASRPIAELKKELKHFDLKLRLRALDDLAARGDAEAAEAVASALDDLEWEVVIRALQVLGELKAADQAEAVARQAMEGEILLIRQAAVGALRAFDIEDVVPRLLKPAGRARKPEVKVRALEAAVALAGASDVEAVLPFLAAREPSVRAAAYRAIGATRNREAVKYARSGLRDKEIAVRVAAGEALGMIGGPEAMEGLRDLVLAEDDPYVIERVVRAFRSFPEAGAEYLSREAGAEKKAERRARLVRVLAHLDHPAAGRPLVAFLSDEDPAVRAWAARGVGRAAHVEGAAALAPLLTGDPDFTVRRMVLEALLALAGEPAERAAHLRRALEEGNPELRIRACVAARLLHDEGLIPALVPLVSEEDWRVATAAIISIGALGHVSEVSALTGRLEDRDWKIRAALYEGLGQLRHMDVVPFLIRGLADPDPVAKSAALKNLQILSQLPREADEEFWRKWYEENRGTLELTKKGYREEIPDDYYGKSKYLIEILNKAQIVCVLGKWDHAEIVLEHLRIQATVIRPQELMTIGLNPKQLLLINCEGSIGKKAAWERLQWFVHTGGYLMTTDWALQNAVVPVFPGYVDRDQKAKTGNDVVIIEPADPGHPLLKGVFDETTRLMWWLEVIAYPMRVVDPFRTEILVDSLEMLERKYGSSTMAAVFDYGHGKVEHCISHFYLQEEGLTNRTTPKDRKIFAADNLGISLKRIREMEAGGFFDGAPDEAMTREIAEDYSMFRLIVNFVVEKRRQVEQD